MVRLQHVFWCVFIILYRVFNPTMVRLQPRQSKGDILSKCIFNPTMVRLQLYETTWENIERIIFNPTMVRLQRSLWVCVYKCSDVFSIPLWCDCNCSNTTGR